MQIIHLDTSNIQTATELENEIKTLIKSDEELVVFLTGCRKNFNLNLSNLENIPQIHKIIDESILEIDYSHLQKTNSKNILGLFIASLKDYNDYTSILALDYGIKSFMEAKNDN